MSNETSGLYKSISALGKAVALAATLIGTPLLFDATKGPLYTYFLKTWGADIAWILVWVMGAIEAYVIYASVSFLFTAGIVWIMTTLAVRRFRE